MSTDLPIKLKKYSTIKEKKSKSDRELLLFMKEGELYITSKIQKFLDINHTATLGRLKKLQKLKYIKRRMRKRIYHWEKILDMEEPEIYEGFSL